MPSPAHHDIIALAINDRKRQRQFITAIREGNMYHFEMVLKSAHLALTACSHLRARAILLQHTHGC